MILGIVITIVILFVALVVCDVVVGSTDENEDGSQKFTDGADK